MKWMRSDRPKLGWNTLVHLREDIPVKATVDNLRAEYRLGGWDSQFRRFDRTG